MRRRAMAARCFGRALAMVLAVLAVLDGAPACAQALHRLGRDFNAVRTVVVPADKRFSVVVTQFFHHGQIDGEGRNVVVLAKSQKPVPSRVLQVGPGDFCRLAFQTAPGQNSYDVLYGGEPLPGGTIPPWTTPDGLLLEVRQYKSCNLNSFEAVREAFESSKPIGADYVDAVHHAGNPVSLKSGPFLSRYSGTMRISSAGTYGLMTSSQDCSFLLIDGTVTASAPGMHGPQYQARPGVRKDVTLSAGNHKFEYYHGAAGAQAIMAAAWEVQPGDPKRAQPKPIPPEVFGAAAVGRVATGPAATRDEKLVPDFLVNIAGSVPLPDNDVQLIGVQFADASPKGLTANSRHLWEFGDGQTSEAANPMHVYLRPGLYRVKLSIRRSGRPFEMANRVEIDQPRVTDRRDLPTLDDYLRILQSYEPRTLDAAGLRQLVLAYQAKAEALAAAAEEKPAPEEKDKPKAGKRPPPRTPLSGTPGQYVAMAVDAGKAAFVEESAAKGDDDLVQLARLVGPMARDQLGNSALAGQIWQGGSKRIAAADLRAECLVEAADVAVNDLSNAPGSKPFLDAATAALGPGKKGPVACRLKRVWGDYYALAGDGKAARKAYAEAESLVESRRSHIERTAWQGARGRSTEQFLKSGQYDRAIAEIRQWQDEYPTDKINGYVTLLYARYWAGRQAYPQAIALAGQLSAVNADSPYVDQLLVLAADCHVKLGAVDRAVATLQSLLKDHPGSPCVPEVKQKLAELQGKGGKGKE